MTLTPLFYENIISTEFALAELKKYFRSQGQNISLEKETVSLFDANKQVVLENVSCIDAKMQIIEKYKRVSFEKEIIAVKNSANENLSNVNTSLQKKNAFIPSIALTCNLLAALYEYRENPFSRQMILEYIRPKEQGVWFKTSSTVNWKEQKMKYYDSRESKFFESKNVECKNSISDSKNAFQNISLYRSGEVLLETLLKENESFVKNLTGLRNPEILCKLAKNYKKEMKIWLPEKVSLETKTFPIFFGSAYNSVYITLHNPFRECEVRLASENEMI